MSIHIEHNSFEHTKSSIEPGPIDTDNKTNHFYGQ